MRNEWGMGATAFAPSPLRYHGCANRGRIDVGGKIMAESCNPSMVCSDDSRYLAVSQRLIQLRPELEVLFASGYTENTIAHHGVPEENLYFLGKPDTIHSLAGN
jgi:hypothetical protein